MTDMQLARRAVRAFPRKAVLAPKATRRHNQRAWIHAVRNLGDRWLFAQPINQLPKH